MQVKLCACSRNGAFRRVGGLEEVQADIRVIAATNQDLTRLVAEGRFREDLFYRINVDPDPLPPLRERRRSDIGPARRALPGEIHRADGREITGISHEAMAAPDGRTNGRYIRELENVLERAVALEATPTILPDSLPPGIRGRSAERRRRTARRSRVRL